MLKIQNISKKIGEFKIKEISLEIKEGEYFVILGKSGAGKSVLLEIIAGLLIPDKGQIFIDNKEMTHEKIQKRNIGLVFQNQSLFPHISVKDNILYPLKAVKKRRSNVQTKVTEVTEVLGISHLLDRNPSTLSLGESQRVALARTLVTEPACLLLDEPLSSLDTQTKAEIRRLLRSINRNGFSNSSSNKKQTIIHVTHDYEEAIALADRVAVFENGKIIQVGEPKDIFRHPKSGFIAKFIGIKNFYRGRLLKDNLGTTGFVIDAGENSKTFYISVPDEIGEGCLVLRSEDITVSNSYHESSARNSFEGRITDIETVRNGIEVTVDIGGAVVSSLITETSLKKLDLCINKKVFVSFKANAARFIRT